MGEPLGIYAFSVHGNKTELWSSGQVGCELGWEDFKQANWGKTQPISVVKGLEQNSYLCIGDPSLSTQRAGLQEYIWQKQTNLTSAERICVGSEEGCVSLECTFGTKF